MKNKVSISLNDHDSYFLAGLQYALIEYFTVLDTQIDFFNGYSTNKPDIIFQALYQGERANICRHFPADKPQPLYFVIRDKAERRFTPPIRCIAKSSTLYRYQSISDMLEMVKLAMQLRSLPPERATHCPICHRQNLTERECQVLHYLRQGMSQSQTASILQLKVKTVHSHKRSAMQKLSFTRNSELFHWLLHDGLASL
jgi:DNA-binding NarL/FixJ family response regulator